MKMSIKILAAKKAKKQVSFRAFFKKKHVFLHRKSNSIWRIVRTVII